MVGRVGPRLVAGPPVRGNGRPQLHVGHRREVGASRLSHVDVVTLREREAETHPERFDQCLHVVSVPVVGRVAEMCEDLPLGREAPDLPVRDHTGTGEGRRRVGEVPTERLRLHFVGMLVRHGRMQIDAPPAGRREHECDRQRVGDRQEAEAPYRGHGIGHPSEGHDQIEVTVGTTLQAEKRIDSPSPVDDDVGPSVRERSEHAERGFSRHHDPNNGKDGDVQIAFLLFPRVTALDAIGPYEVLQRLPGAEVVFVGAQRGEVRTDNGYLGLTVDADARRGAGSPGLGRARGHGHPAARR